MSADFLNIFSPAKETCFQKRNRTEKIEDIVDICAILQGLGYYVYKVKINELTYE